MSDSNTNVNTEGQLSTQDIGRLENFPISFFSIIMGLSGFSIVWEKLAKHYQLPPIIPEFLAWLTFSVFILLTLAYLTKIVRHPKAVLAEIKHPVKLSFFPSFSIGMLLLSIVMIEIQPQLAKALWIMGISVHFVLFLYVVNSWMHHKHYQIQHISPAWFIPAVGNLLVPITGTHFGFIEISWFFFSIGITFWVILFTIFFYRILFHNPLPNHLVPTFFILIAPPAVGFTAYVKLTGGVDNFAHVLYYIGLFLTILLISQFKQFARLPFFLSWWAYSFPVAAITISSFLMHHHTQDNLFLIITNTLATLLTSLISLIIVKTLKAMFAKKICVEMH